MRRSSLVISAVLSLLAASCAGPGGSVARSATPASPDDAVQSPIVAPGTPFHARLETPISSDGTRVGDVLVARLDEPLVAGNGTVVAPRGALLTGRVLEVERGGLGRVTLRFDRLHIGGRTYLISTTLLRMQSTRVVPAIMPLASPPGAVMSFVLARPFELPPAWSAMEVENAAEVDRTFH